MSTFQGGPQNIVTNGLVLYLDAANRESYSSGSTTWRDLSGNNNNGTLINGVGFSNDNAGSMVFDGSNDYVNFFAPNLGTTTTVEMWCNIGAGYTGKMFFGWLRYDVWCGSGHLGYNTGGSDVYGISSTTVSNLGLVNNWKHYIFEMRSDVSYTNNKIYINTSLQSLSQQLNSQNSGNRNFNSGEGRIAIWRNDLNNYFMPMNCAAFKVYNRALTAQEILQNYNSTKARYGL